jgi:hypothetical protein
MSSLAELHVRTGDTAVLDSAHVGDIRGALGTIRRDDIAPRNGWWTHLRTLLAILGPGLTVMVGDNDAGAFGTYTQAGQDYGTTLLWTLLLLVPVLYVNQEMVLRLGTVTGVGHARLILERFGRFWGAFSVIDLFLLNWHQPGARLPGAAARTRGHCFGRDHHRCRWDGRFPALRAVLATAGLRQPVVDPGVRLGSPAAVTDRS